MKDYYAALGVGQSATLGEIREAYRKQARDLHPDRNACLDAKDRFLEIGEAYQVMKSPSRRNEYDAKVIADYCGRLVGSFEEDKDKEKARHSEFYRIMRK
ncbi:MAG: DnaJ domain-containing protein [Gammaproteobacteria bacterium]|nr:DnaJ domain-containing protein [Gammaproteobacteria bacterium]